MRRLSLVIALFIPVLASTGFGQGGSIMSWGDDQDGQVSNTPVGPEFAQVVGGGEFSIALKDDGSIISWGADTELQVSNTPGGVGYSKVSAGWRHGLALKQDGSLISWGRDSSQQVSDTPPGFDFVEIACGREHSAALRSDGTIVSWGDDFRGEVSNTPPGNDFIQIACGWEFSVAIRNDNSMVSWGYNGWGQVSGTPSGVGFVQIAAGKGHAVSLKDDGSVVSWGSDLDGQISNTPPGTGFSSVAAGDDHSLAIRTDGSLVSWGFDGDGQVSNTPVGTEFAQGEGGANHSIVLLNPDSDSDGINDKQEDRNENGIVDIGETDWLDQDTDDDGLSDGEEVNTFRSDTRWIQGSTGNFYRLAGADTWSQARALAVSQGYDLASVQDQAEADWLYSTFGEISSDFWVGLTDFSGVFEWSDGSPVSYTQWATGEPITTFVAAYVGGLSSSEPGNWYAEFAGLTPRMAVWEAPGPNPPQTALDPLSWDTDGDGLGDGQEYGRGAIVWNGDIDGDGVPDVGGTDPLVFVPDSDPLSTTDPLDLDSDEDGLSDGVEDADGDGSTGLTETSPLLADTDGDGLTDGLELGLTVGTVDTDGNTFTPDADPLTTTDPLQLDTDLGGVVDGIEDQNHDGAVDTWETDPNLGSDEAFAFYVSNVLPGEKLRFEVFNATPNTPILPAASLAGAGPIMLTIGILMDLSPPIYALAPRLAGSGGHAAWEGQRLPNAVQLGREIWFQAIEVPLSPFLPPRASNSILLPVGSN